MSFMQKLKQEIKPFAEFAPDSLEINCSKSWILLNEIITSSFLLLVLSQEYFKRTSRGLLTNCFMGIRFMKEGGHIPEA